MAGRFAEAQPLQEKVIGVDYFGMTHGVAALKGALNLLGYECGVPRRPTKPLTSDQEKELRVALGEAGLLGAGK